MSVTASQSARLSGWRTYLRDLWARRELVWFLAAGNLKAQNANSSLGLLWWVINPLLDAVLYFLVFGVLFNAREQDPLYVSALVSGLFVFEFTVKSMNGAVGAINRNMALLANIRFPRLVLPLSAVVEALMGFLTSIIAFYLVVWPIDGVPPSINLLLLLLVVPIHIVFNLGIGATAARLAIPFRDIANLLPHVQRLWLYATPILWPASLLASAPEWATTLIRFNPLYPFVGLYREALMQRPAEPWMLPAALAWAAVAVLIGVLTFVRYEGNMARHV
jgi:teichoic acid transport system permease protein